MNLNLNEIINRQADALIENINKSLNFKFTEPIKIIVNQFSKSEENDKNEFDKIFSKKIDILSDKNCIYIITANKFFKDWETLNNKIKELKAEGNHLSKVNEPFKFINFENEPVLYVGSKISGIKTRLMQHLGIYSKSRSTYSLYLRDWMEDDSIKITIWLWSFKEISDAQLELIEDFLWEGLKPLFGKKGATFNRKAVS